jgi:hypothetical protein
METVFSNVKKLTEIDNYKAANLLLNYLDNEKKIKSLLNSLEKSPKILYKLLYGILLGSANKHHKRDLSTGSINLELLSIKEQRKQTLISDPIIQEKFIELMCKIEPNSVYNNLKILEGYRLEIALVVSFKPHKYDFILTILIFIHFIITIDVQTVQYKQRNRLFTRKEW